MTDGRPAPEADRPDAGLERDVDALRAAVAAERAGVDHWRRVADQRTAALDGLRRRPLVRAALALEHRTAGLRSRGAAGARRLRRHEERGLLAAAALAHRPALHRRRPDLAAARAELPPAPSLDRTVTVIVAGATGPPSALVRGAGPVQLVVGAGARVGPAPGVEVVPVGPGGVTSTVANLLAAADTDLLCLVAPTVEPVDASWLARLAAEAVDDVAVVTARVLHAERRWTAATPLDLLVREAGLVVADGPDGAPRLRFRDAGSRAADAAGPIDVDAASATCVVLDRAACAAAGGLGSTGDLDLAVVDLCFRLRAAGRRVRCAQDVLVVDDRPVVTRRELQAPRPDDDVGWRRVVDDHGSRLRSSARSGHGGRLRFALTVASPSAKVAEQWGDWHLAEALGAALRGAGHEVRVQTHDMADSPAGRACDVHVVLRGLAPVRRTVGQAHVLWIISHPEAVDADECDRADLVLVASARFAAVLRERTSTPVAVLLQATDPDRFRPRPPDQRHQHPVTVVARSRDVLRPMVADALAAGLRPAIYGTGWTGLVNRDLVVADHVPNDELPVVYSSAGVVLNDHWATMRAWGFVSNRVFDVLACGAPLVSDHLPEIADLFGDLVPMWRTPQELGAAVAAIFADPSAAADRASKARRTVLASHTFERRAEELLALLAAHGLAGPHGDMTVIRPRNVLPEKPPRG